MQKAFAILIAVMAIVLGSTPDAHARVDVHIGIAVPPPPTVVFERAPEPILVPHSEVYYAPSPEYDVYRYGGYWYVNRGGYWYRGGSYQGPFAPIVYERVPHAILVVPGGYHHYPFRPPLRRVGPSDHFRGGDGGHWDHGNRGGDHGERHVEHGHRHDPHGGHDDQHRHDDQH